MVMYRMPAQNGTVSHSAANLSYDGALALVARYGGDATWTRHCRAVSIVAERAGQLMAMHCTIDQDFLRIAALIHDIGRYRTHDPVQHGVEGYHLLTSLGHHREAFICASHIQCGLSAAEAVQAGLPERDFMPRSLEERLIPVLDSIVELDRPTTVERRFASLSRRYQGNGGFLESVERSRRRVRAVMDDLERHCRLSLEQIAAEALR